MVKNEHYEIRMAVAREIADKLMPFVKGAFVVGSVAYNPDVVNANDDVDLVGVADDFANVDFNGIGKTLNVEMDERAINLAKERRIDVFGIDILREEVKAGVYLWNNDAKEAVCSFEPIRRFTSSLKLPRSCNLMDLRGREWVIDGYESIEGKPVGKIYTHYPVTRIWDGENSGIWLGVPAVNLLMNPVALKGEEFLREYFDRFTRNFRTACVCRYGPSMTLEGNPRNDINLINAFPQALKERMTDKMRHKLERFF